MIRTQAREHLDDLIQREVHNQAHNSWQSLTETLSIREQKLQLAEEALKRAQESQLKDIKRLESKVEHLQKAVADMKISIKNLLEADNELTQRYSTENQQRKEKELRDMKKKLPKEVSESTNKRQTPSVEKRNIENMNTFEQVVKQKIVGPGWLEPIQKRQGLNTAQEMSVHLTMDSGGKFLQKLPIGFAEIKPGYVR